MVNHLLKYSFLSFCILAFTACDEDGIDVTDVTVPDGYALSAGTSTLF